MSFYVKSLMALKARQILRDSDSVLVVAGGSYDRDSLLEAGFQNVCISNLGHHAGEKSYEPYQWVRLDAEKIAVADASYDWVIINAGLHHLAVPAAGVCEMFRAARKGIICFEARDSIAMRVARIISLTSDYELEPAYLSGGRTGGYRDGPIPNYVYRWTEREFEKVIKTYSPAYRVEFSYFYGLAVPLRRFAMARSPLFRVAGRGLHAFAKIFPHVCPRQGNQFAMVAVKTNALQPWLAMDAGQLRFRDDALSKKFDKSKYV